MIYATLHATAWDGQSSGVWWRHLMTSHGGNYGEMRRRWRWAERRWLMTDILYSEMLSRWWWVDVAFNIHFLETAISIRCICYRSWNCSAPTVVLFAYENNTNTAGTKTETETDIWLMKARRLILSFAVHHCSRDCGLYNCSACISGLSGLSSIWVLCRSIEISDILPITNLCVSGGSLKQCAWCLSTYLSVCLSVCLYVCLRRWGRACSVTSAAVRCSLRPLFFVHLSPDGVMLPVLSYS